MIPVVDLFAGPGGLNEGFTSLKDAAGNAVFRTVGSFEMEAAATETLTLRAAFHRARANNDDGIYYRFLRDEIPYAGLASSRGFGTALKDAAKHVHRVELGETTREEYAGAIRRELARSGADSPWVLVGGPPCQAYSIVGRSRRAHDVDFEQDAKHFLYREYLHIIAEFGPPVFVMENVKGLLSSKHGGTRMIDRILDDLRNPTAGLEYHVLSLTTDGAADSLEPTDYVIRAEQYGVPQARHRVILLGVRSDLVEKTSALPRLSAAPSVSVKEAIGEMPALRSGISRGGVDSLDRWQELVAGFRKAAVADGIVMPRSGIRELDRGGRFRRADRGVVVNTSFAAFVTDAEIGGVIQHESRAHMASDLERYYYAASLARQTKRSPKLADFPPRLLPNHKNATADSRPFEDRFRVQVGERPSSTVVSHIAKDGHYFIHPDPTQVRSLTVREAARLQTFPDNYYFMGNRTQQYTQVGNAVPPLLASQVAEIVSKLLS